MNTRVCTRVRTGGLQGFKTRVEKRKNRNDSEEANFLNT